MKEERKKIYEIRWIFITSILSLMSMLLSVGCSNQQRPVSSTICGNDGHVLAGLDTVMEFSPNEEWILANCASISGESKYARVFRVDGSVSWKISTDAFSWNKNENDPLARLASFHWMEDGKSVYLRPICCYDPSNHGIIGSVYSLYLLNLQTGELSIILSGENDNAAPFSVDISPDGRFLVYVDLENNPNILHVSNLQNGEQKTLELDKNYSDIGAYVWTPDSRKLIFTAVPNGWETSSLYVLEMNNFVLTAIVENDERLLFPTNKWDYQGKWGYWKDENTIFLVELGGDRDWAVNIQTGAIVEDNSYDGPP